jgi:glycosyltransferase involved in cell wall biosynthesis
MQRERPFRNFSSQNKVSKDTLSTQIRNFLQLIVDFSTSTIVKLNYMKKLLTHSEEMRERLMKNFFPISDEKITKIPAPTSPISEDISQASARDKLNLSKNKPMLLFFGEMRREKGPDILVRSLKSIDQECLVVFAGKEGYIQKSTIKKQDISPNVEIETRFEYIPEDHLNLYFIAADLLVLPYRRKRGISGPLRQAVMADTAVISSHPTDIGSIINENNIGGVFNIESEEELSEKINQFLQGNITIPSKYINSYAKQIHYQSVGEEIERIYDEII